MGYYVSMGFDSVVISRRHRRACLQVMNDMFDEAHPRYAWVDKPEGGWDRLSAAFTAWRIHTRSTDEGLILEYFDGEKWGDEEALFNAIAPFVDDGGIITVYGEEHEAWRYVFENGEAIREEGRLEFIRY